MHKYKAVGFDYGGVIGGGPKVGEKFTAEVSETLGIEIEVYRKAYFGMNRLINTGKVVTWREFWALFLNKLNLPEGKLDLIMRISDAASKQYVVMDQDVLDLINKLRAAGYKTGLLSNATLENGQQLRAAGLGSYFDVFFISAEIGLQKPNPKLYRRFATALEVETSELVFVDDAQVNMQEAEELGISTVLYEGLGSLQNQL